MARLNPRHIEAVIALINRGPFFEHLSMRVLELGPAHSLVEMEVGRKHLTPFGGLHGGAYAAVIDTAAYWSAYADLAEGVGLTTLDLRVDFLAPFQAGKIRVQGRCLRKGRTICLTEALAFDSENRQLAHGISKLMVLKKAQSIEDAVAFLGSAPLPPKFL